VKNLGIGQRQLVEIAKALAKDARILIMDEPTSVLTESEVDVLLDITLKLKAKGISVIYISHRLDEVMRIANEITVTGRTDHRNQVPFADGQGYHDQPDGVGRELKNLFPRDPQSRGELVFEVRNFSVPNPDVPDKLLIHNVSFKAYKGEILGSSGLIEAGRTELFAALFGAFREGGMGEIVINSKSVFIKGPVNALKNGFVVLSEDRKKLGLNLLMNIKENITLAALQKVSRFGVLDDDKERGDTYQSVHGKNQDCHTEC
jgi:D-xylose transport system ATP-binding protein